MKRFLALATVVALGCATSVWAADLNVRVVSGGSASVNVSGGATVDYEVYGVLTSDTDNLGLALVGFDLELLDDVGAHAGDLDAAVTPALEDGSMYNFVKGPGITNPDGPCPPACGYGGTIIGGKLVQIGGGQNTINNDIGNAPYPIGTVMTRLAHTEILLAWGSLTAPGADGTYYLTLSELFVNVITVEQATFWSVATAGVGTIDNLEINVGASCLVDTTFPPNCAVDARQSSAPDGTAPAGWDSIDINYLDGSCAGALAPGDVTVTVHPDDVPVPTVEDVVAVGATATLSLSTAIPTGHWTCFHIGEDSKCLGYLPADVNGDGTSSPSDILRCIDCLNGVSACETWQCDVDRSDSCAPPDILRVIDLLNGAGVYDAWLNVSIEDAVGDPLACPSGG